MALRAMMEQKKGSAMAAAVGLIVIAGALLAYQMSGQTDGVTTPAAFYTDDDGATFFRGEQGLVPPFDHEGKTATIAHVGKCPDGTTAVYYMQRFTPSAQGVVKKIKARDANVSAKELEALAVGREYKKTGDKDWKVISGDNEVRQWLMGVGCKDKSQPKWLDE